MIIFNDYSDSCVRCAHSENEPTQQPCKVCARNGYYSNDTQLNYYEVPEGINHVTLTDTELEMIKNVMGTNLEIKNGDEQQ